MRARPAAACTPACKRPGWSAAGARSTDTAAAAARTGRRIRRRRTLRNHNNSYDCIFENKKGMDRCRFKNRTYHRSKGLRGLCRGRGGRGAVRGGRGVRPRGPPRPWPAPAPRATRRAASTPRLQPAATLALQPPNRIMIKNTRHSSGAPA